MNSVRVGFTMYQLCPILDCGDVIEFNSLKQHIFEEHDFDFMNEDDDVLLL